MSFSAEFKRQLQLQAEAKPWRFWEYVALAAFVIGMVVILAVSIGLADKAPKAVILAGTLALCACAAWVAGSLTGFLFGVPRFKAGVDNLDLSDDRNAIARYAPNTNLEQVSDWLTKIVIGATLVQLQSIPPAFQRMCEWISADFSEPRLAPIVGAVIIYFGFTGFLWCYLWSSIRVMRELAELYKQGGGDA